jgi:hypothetical protein
MDQSKGLVMLGQEKKVCEVVKSLYDLKQAPNMENLIKSCYLKVFKQILLINMFILNKFIMIM